MPNIMCGEMLEKMFCASGDGRLFVVERVFNVYAQNCTQLNLEAPITVCEKCEFFGIGCRYLQIK